MACATRRRKRQRLRGWWFPSRLLVGPVTSFRLGAVGYPATELVRRVLQDLLDEAGLEMRVSVEAV